MEFNQKLSELLNTKQYPYLLVNVIARRARMLNDGARPELALRAENPMDYTRVAIAEIEQEKLRVEPSERAGQMVDIAGIVK